MMAAITTNRNSDYQSDEDLLIHGRLASGVEMPRGNPELWMAPGLGGTTKAIAWIARFFRQKPVIIQTHILFGFPISIMRR